MKITPGTAAAAITTTTKKIFASFASIPVSLQRNHNRVGNFDTHIF